MFFIYWTDLRAALIVQDNCFKHARCTNSLSLKSFSRERNSYQIINLRSSDLNKLLIVAKLMMLIVSWS